MKTKKLSCILIEELKKVMQKRAKKAYKVKIIQAKLMQNHNRVDLVYSEIEVYCVP